MRNLFFISVMTLMGSLSAQDLVVDQVNFTSNPAAFSGKMILIKGIYINASSPKPSAPSPAPIGIRPRPASSPDPTDRCNAPRSFVPLNVEFPDDPNFQACFFMSQSMFSSVPKCQDKIQVTLIFKGDHRTGYAVTMYKMEK
jgi:hypothetical protein